MATAVVTYPKRLIEVDLPIKRISAHARREKSIRHGHISTLHIWWARRPLAACRAVICAALWPDPAGDDPPCPQSFRKAAARIITEFARKAVPSVQLRNTCSPESFARWEALVQEKNLLNTKDPAYQNILRFALLDFIADFANWDNSTVPEYLETARALTQAAHEALGGEPGTRPLVVDPFAGGGSIPLEALRVGADAFASDLNPVAVLLNKVVLEYIPKYGQGLAAEVRKWGQLIQEQAEKELAQFYPKDPDGATPIAYLWARTITCEGPGCGTEVPLIGSLWLAKKRERSVALRLVPRPKLKRVDFEIAENAKLKDVAEGTVRRGSMTCPVCGFTTPVASSRRQLKKRHGGSVDARLICVVTIRTDQQGRSYRLPSNRDIEAVRKATKELERKKTNHHGTLSLLPNEPTPLGEGSGAGRAFSQRVYGMDNYSDLYLPRQLLALSTFVFLLNKRGESGFPESLRPFLALALGRVCDLSMTLCRWVSIGEFVASANGGQNRMPVVLDFAETVPVGDSGGSWVGQIDWIARVIEHIGESHLHSGTTNQGPAQEALLPLSSVDAFVTDPPYYDAFPYSDLSDFFFVWLKRAFPEAFATSQTLVPKDDEIVVYDVVHGSDNRVKDKKFFQEQMTKVLEAYLKAMKPAGIGLVVFANKTTGGWESLLQSIIDAGWTATASWPIDTERPTRQRAIGSAALGSSVHVVCRPRSGTEIGDWRDVLTELPRRIHEWMPRLASEGVVGADAIFACLGPALEIFSRYAKVEKASGECVELKEYLAQVWAAVAKEALTMIFAGADVTGFDPDARLTAMWFWTLSTGGTTNGKSSDEDENEGEPDEDSPGTVVKGSGFVLEYDAARKIAQGLGANLEQLSQVVEVKGDKATLLAVSDRARFLFGKDEGNVPTKGKKNKIQQRSLFEEAGNEGAEEGQWGDLNASQVGTTVLDRLHQCMILFGAGRSDALKRFLVEEGVGRDTRFWRLAQAMSALYPPGTEEKRWVDGVLARKKGLGF